MWRFQPALDDAVCDERKETRAQDEGDHGKRANDSKTCSQVVVQRREVLSARWLRWPVVVPDVRHRVLSPPVGYRDAGTVQ